MGWAFSTEPELWAQPHRVEPTARSAGREASKAAELDATPHLW